MKKVLIVYFSLSGKTQTMAQYVAEGIRISGQQATLKKAAEIKDAAELDGYDGYIFASPTYYLDMGAPMKTFLFLARKADLAGKLAGSFGSFTHDGNAPRMIFDTMQHVFNMEPFELGPFNLVEGKVGTDEGLRACQAFGRTFGESLGK
ncbi:MAG: nitric oxide synthase [Chloroflexi bacterium RBG_16_58_8]|nr:MAG: nitric oxide synthase [Chloroflexi bacterium RBG_16_58_8]